MKGILKPVPAATLDAIEADCAGKDTATIGTLTLASLVAEVKLRRRQQQQHQTAQNAHVRADLPTLTPAA